MMDMTDRNSPESLEYLYKEYVRLMEKADSYARSSFDDFKLLAAVGALLGWPPIVNALTQKDQQSIVLLIGFLGILFLVAIIGTRDLLKQSITNYLLQQLRSYETEIRTRLDQNDTGTFRFSENWELWSDHKHKRVAARFYILFYLIVVAFPTIVLVLQEPRWYAAIYTPIAFLVLGIYLNANKVLYEI